LRGFRTGRASALPRNDLVVLEEDGRDRRASPTNSKKTARPFGRSVNYLIFVLYEKQGDASLRHEDTERTGIHEKP
jgi:hypothetical protein